MSKIHIHAVFSDLNCATFIYLLKYHYTLHWKPHTHCPFLLSKTPPRGLEFLFDLNKILLSILFSVPSYCVRQFEVQGVLVPFWLSPLSFLFFFLEVYLVFSKIHYSYASIALYHWKAWTWSKGLIYCKMRMPRSFWVPPGRTKAINSSWRPPFSPRTPELILSSLSRHLWTHSSDSKCSLQITLGCPKRPGW